MGFMVIILQGKVFEIKANYSKVQCYERGNGFMMTNCELQIAVCDDDYMSREKNSMITGKVLDEAGISYKIEKYESAKALLDAIHKGTQFQIFLLDVMMNEMDGMELATELRKQKNTAEIIFISGNQENALRGYEVAAARYLAKPVIPERLQEALLFCYDRYKDTQEFVVLAATGNYKVYLSEIRYVEAFERGTRFYLKENFVDTKIKISEVEELLPSDRFILCHRAYIVNISEIRVVRRYEIELKSGDVIPVSRIRYTEVYESFLQ